MNTELLNEMRVAVANKTAQVLTLEKAKELKGKKIRTIYFGYRGQDGVDEFVVGEIISHLAWAERNVDFDSKWKSQGDYWKSYMTAKQLDEHNTNMLLLREDGTSTSCCCHTKYWNCFNELTFTCSDADREVYYVELSELETALIPFFKEHHTSSHSFMHVEIYGNKEREEKSNNDLKNALQEHNLVNPYSSLNELREQAILWHCVDTTERLIANGEKIDPDMNPTEWRKF